MFWHEKGVKKFDNIFFLYRVRSFFTIFMLTFTSRLLGVAIFFSLSVFLAALTTQAQTTRYVQALVTIDDRDERVYQGERSLPLMGFRLHTIQPCNGYLTLGSVRFLLQQGNINDVTDLYLAYNNVAISNVVPSVQSDRTITFSTNIDIPNCQSDNFVLYGNLPQGGVVSKTIRFVIDEKSDVSIRSSDVIEGMFPLIGPRYTVVDANPLSSAPPIVQSIVQPSRRVTPSVSMLTDAQRRALRNWIRNEVKVAVAICKDDYTLLSQIVTCMLPKRLQIRAGIKDQLRLMVYGEE